MFDIISHQEMQIKATRNHTAPKHMAINKRKKEGKNQNQVVLNMQRN